MIHPTPEIVRASRNRLVIPDPTDNFILASILDHAANHPDEIKVLLTENRKDFDGPAARLALRDAGVGYFADPSKFLEWHRTRPE